MKISSYALSLFLFVFILTSCGTKKTGSNEEAQEAADSMKTNIAKDELDKEKLVSPLDSSKVDSLVKVAKGETGDADETNTTILEKEELKQGEIKEAPKPGKMNSSELERIKEKKNKLKKG